MDTRGRWQRSASSVGYWAACLVLESASWLRQVARRAWRRWQRSRARARAQAAHRRHVREKWQRLAAWQRDDVADLRRLDRRR